MASAPLMDRNNSEIRDIEALARPTLDERSRQGFCSALRRHAIRDMVEELHIDFTQNVDGRGGEEFRNARDIAQAMRARSSFKFYSSVRYNVQEMCFHSVQPQIERALPQMIETARDAAARSPAGGSLRLNPNLEVPRYVTALDVHLTPGCFHSEWTEDDVAQGAVVGLGSRVFAANMNHRMFGGVAMVISRWIKATYPSFRPRRILDIGTSSGKNLLPYVKAFPGVEAYGVDVGAPLLRYGHAVAEHEGVPIHFSQQNAEALDFPDGFFDLIVSSFFFHEIPVKSTRNVLRECYRLLSPQGLMVHQELPATNLVDAWEDYFWNWDTKNNNEPSYTAFRAEDPIALCNTAGFDAQKAFAKILPDVTAYPDRATEFEWDEPGRPMHGRGGWYVFGAWKS